MTALRHSLAASEQKREIRWLGEKGDDPVIGGWRLPSSTPSPGRLGQGLTTSFLETTVGIRRLRGLSPNFTGYPRHARGPGLVHLDAAHLHAPVLIPAISRAAPQLTRVSFSLNTQAPD